MAQINANTWAIAGRGLNWEFANGLLVMVDGRTVYTQTTLAECYWDVLDIPLEDIERIEVIRGPGGTSLGCERRQWRDQRSHQKCQLKRTELLLVAGGGNLDQGFGTAQYGGSVGKNRL